jgi:putative cell wall-binding protein
MTAPPRGHRPAIRRALTGTTLLAALLVPALPASADTTTRLSPTADTNTQAAIAYSSATFADGAATTVLLARDDDFADSLTSGSLQGLLDAPLLLTNSDVLSPDTMAEIQRLDPDLVLIMGGDDAVSPTVEQNLQSMGRTTDRVFGATRIETATTVAARFFGDATVALVARGFGDEQDPSRAFADSITAGNFSAASEIPILLTATEALSPPTQTYIAGSSIEAAHIVGGTDAVSQPVEASLNAIDVSDNNPDGPGDPADPADAAPGFVTTRQAGITRADTAVKLNNELGYASAAEPPRVILIESRRPDAWASGLTAAVQAGNGAATVLADGPGLFQETQAFLGMGAGTDLICGPRVADSACDAASTALGNEG